MNAYVVADQRWAFGRNGGLLFSLSADLERFHSLTRNGTVIMGPERLEFFTGGTPLSQRRNIVVTRDPSILPEGAEGVSSPEKALALAGGPEAENLWIIGGGPALPLPPGVPHPGGDPGAGVGHLLSQPG